MTRMVEDKIIERRRAFNGICSSSVSYKTNNERPWLKDGGNEEYCLCAYLPLLASAPRNMFFVFDLAEFQSETAPNLPFQRTWPVQKLIIP